MFTSGHPYGAALLQMVADALFGSHGLPYADDVTALGKEWIFIALLAQQAQNFSRPASGTDLTDAAQGMKTKDQIGSIQCHQGFKNAAERFGSFILDVEEQAL